MYIKLQTIKQKYNLQIKGIIHVGAHFGEEFDDYRACGVRDIVFVEPCEASLEILQKRFDSEGSIDEHVQILPFAFGEEDRWMDMYTETKNSGQSNSLLKPAKHLEQFPDIQFNGRERIHIRRMDSFGWLRGKHDQEDEEYNFLNMDVQGFELNVLKGGVKTLKKIDYIYTEVNQAEVYEGCARIEQLDEFLSDFQRVETFWCDGGAVGDWGDAFYIRKSLMQ
jgi:FkbM family methyltransferase